MKCSNQKKFLAVVLSGLMIGLAQEAMANPVLTPGTWKEITPSSVPTGDPTNCIGQGIALDPRNPSVIYWCNGPYNNGGLYKSTDAGSSWVKMGADSTDPDQWDNHTFLLNNPLRIRIDPANSLHMYCCVGVRGNNGFWITTDGGVHWNMPDSFASWAKSSGSLDVYDAAVEPTDFNHILLSFHSAWASGDAGIAESKDGGTTWTAHQINGSGAAGKSIDFLYDPAKGIGDKNTWLMGTQGNGFWRTADGGTTWTMVSGNDILHGGSNICYTKNKELYVPGYTTCMRSSDNGATWSNVGPQGTWCIFSDGATLYTGRGFQANVNYNVSSATDGATWTSYNAQTFGDGPYDMVLDSVNHIIYSSNWEAGVWALKLTGTGGTAVISPAAHQASGTSRTVGAALCAGAGQSRALQNLAGNGNGVAIYGINGAVLRPAGGRIDGGKTTLAHQAIVTRSE